jgi:hypothetical protein
VDMGAPCPYFTPSIAGWSSKRTSENKGFTLLFKMSYFLTDRLLPVPTKSATMFHVERLRIYSLAILARIFEERRTNVRTFGSFWGLVGAADAACRVPTPYPDWDRYAVADGQGKVVVDMARPCPYLTPNPHYPNGQQAFAILIRLQGSPSE